MDTEGTRENVPVKGESLDAHTSSGSEITSTTPVLPVATAPDPSSADPHVVPDDDDHPAEKEVHQALLGCLEQVILSGSKGIPLKELQHNLISSKEFSKEMRNACGLRDNEDSHFLEFLSRHPSMFFIEEVGAREDEGTTKPTQIVVKAAETSSTTTKSAKESATEQPAIPSSSPPADQVKPSTQPVDDAVYPEGKEHTETVKLILLYILGEKPNKKWLVISELEKELRDHYPNDGNLQALSESPGTMRNFLQQHPLIFEVQGELVGLRRKFSSSSTTSSSSGKSGGGPPTSVVRRRGGGGNRSSGATVRPKSLHIQKSVFSTDLVQTAGEAPTHCALLETPDLDLAGYNATSLTYSAPTTPVKSATSPVQPSISANEYKAVLCISKILSGNSTSAKQPTSTSSFMPIPQLRERLLLEADQGVRSTIGYTSLELEEFLQKHELFFQLKKGRVACKSMEQRQKCNIVITGSRPVMESVRTLCNQCGRVCHVSKQWSILDLGNHEHVFFDKSIFKHVTDLRTHFKVNELLYFNAILAPKGSRARWRATHIWKEADQSLLLQQQQTPRSSAAPTPFGYVPMQPYISQAALSLLSPTTAAGNSQTTQGKYRPLHTNKGSTTPSASSTNTSPWTAFNGKKARDVENWRQPHQQQSTSASNGPVRSSENKSQTSTTPGRPRPPPSLEVAGDTVAPPHVPVHHPRTTLEIRSVSQILQDRQTALLTSAASRERAHNLSKNGVETHLPSTAVAFIAKNPQPQHQHQHQQSKSMMQTSNNNNNNNHHPKANTHAIATQTLITGDIMATHFFHED